MYAERRIDRRPVSLDARRMIVLYGKRLCIYCWKATRLLRKQKLRFEWRNATPEVRADLTARTGSRTVPQIFFGETFIGGYTELQALADSGQLLLRARSE